MIEQPPKTEQDPQEISEDSIAVKSLTENIVLGYD
jgi:hypothetical protein